MSSRRIGLSIAFATAVGLPSVAYSQQSASKVFAALTTDSTAWQRVLAYTVGELSSQLVESASDPTPQPWIFNAHKRLHQGKTVAACEKISDVFR